MPTIEIDAAPERLVPLETWIAENRANRSVWLSGSPHLYSAEHMPRWLRRNEARLVGAGAVMRLGRAWRLIEPKFYPAMMAILHKERGKANKRK